MIVQATLRNSCNKTPTGNTKTRKHTISRRAAAELLQHEAVLLQQGAEQQGAPENWRSLTAVSAENQPARPLSGGP